MCVVVWLLQNIISIGGEKEFMCYLLLNVVQIVFCIVKLMSSVYDFVM